MATYESKLEKLAQQYREKQTTLQQEADNLRREHAHLDELRNSFFWLATKNRSTLSEITFRCPSDQTTANIFESLNGETQFTLKSLDSFSEELKDKKHSLKRQMQDEEDEYRLTITRMHTTRDSEQA